MTNSYSMDYFCVLPSEILENIFSYLIPPKLKKNSFTDHEKSIDTDLKRATLVCRRWNQVISGSSALMSRFVLQITELLLYELEYPVTNRRYQACELFRVQKESFNKCISIMRNNWNEIKDITFHGTFPENYATGTSILDSCRNIETVRLYNVYDEKKFKALKHLKTRNFPKLKTLSIINHAQHILECFKFLEIENLTVYSKYTFEFPSFNEWQLEKLEIGKIFNTASLISFLNSQKPFLKELAVNFNSFIMEYIMRELPQLTKLKLSIDHLPEIDTLIVPTNTHLKELTIVYSQLSMRTDFMQMLFRHYPYVESLKLDFFYGGWAFTHENSNSIILTNLRHLSVKSNSNFVFLRGQFPNLKSLHVDYFRGSMIYNIPSIKTLEKLTISITSFKISTLAEFYPNLKFLSVGDGIELNEKEMKRIIRALPHLETLIIKRYLWKIEKVPKDFLSMMNVSKLSVVFQRD